MNDENYLNKIKKDFNELNTSFESLKLSFKKCEKIGLKKNYNFEEQESFDSFTSKFSRTSDIYTQKILKTIFLLLRESPKSFIDRANLAEKLEIIPSADDLISIRDLRNEIVHEYMLEELTRIYKEIFSNYNKLILAIDKTREFVNKRNWENV
ncbi:MAG: hypothetical protein ACYCVH_16360 [Ignavibacteriaceae bacterium]